MELASVGNLSTSLKNMPGFVYRHEMHGGKWKPVFISEGVKRLLGYEAKYFMEHREQIYENFIDESDFKRIWEQIDQAIREKRPFEVVYRNRTASGESKWVWERGEAIFSPTGEPLALEGVVIDVTRHKELESRLQSSLESSVKERFRFGEIIGKSPAMQQVYELILKAAQSDANVIVYGESGTGKELVSKAIHDLSGYNSGAFIPVNCGAIPENLLESEFFGYKKGAFTGANTDKRGYLAAADGGTLFLDELGEIDPSFQVKLLRILEGKGYAPLGSDEIKTPNVRFITATNRDLPALVKKGRMREDFFYRIHVIPIHIPPLRDRREDFPLIIDHFMKKSGYEGRTDDLPYDIQEALQKHTWPGNVRELQNIINRYIVLGDLEMFQGMLPKSSSNDSDLPEPGKMLNKGLHDAMAEFEKQFIRKALVKNHWQKGKTAQRLGITPRSLYRKIKQYKID